MASEGGKSNLVIFAEKFFRLPQYYNLGHPTSPVHHSANHKHLHIHQTTPPMKEEDKGDFEPTSSIDRRPSPLRQAVPNVQDTRLPVKRQDLHPTKQRNKPFIVIRFRFILTTIRITQRTTKLRSDSRTKQTRLCLSIKGCR